jgi:DNA-binding transcriptional LysR family regulator
MAPSSGRITLWGVEVFVATAQEASISAAARRLGSSAATVSQQLTNLETSVGAILLNRNERPITLTSAGEKFLRRANAILNEADQARLELSGDNSGLTRLRLGMIEDFESDVTPRLLGEIGDVLKSCQFLLETGPSHQLHDLLDARALDMIVAADLPTMTEGLERHALMQEPFVIAAPKGAVDMTAPLPDLRRLPMIQYTTRHFMGQVIAAHLARENFPLAHRFELDSYHAILAMVAGGAGWSILTPMAWLRAERVHDQLDLIPLPFAPLSRQIALTARRGALADTPTQVADRLRPLIDDLIVGPAVAAYPWLKGQLTTL